MNRILNNNIPAFESRGILVILLCAAIFLALPCFGFGADETVSIESLEKRIEFLEKKIDLLNRELDLERTYRKEAEEERDELLLYKRVREIEEDVTRIRNLSATRRIDLDYMSSREFHDYMMRELEAYMPDALIRDYTLCLYQMGFLKEMVDLKKIVMGLYSEQAAGMYDDKTGKLYVMKSFDMGKRITDVIIAHEICHALQDQHYDLSELPIRIPYNDDLAMAAMSVVEGDATVLMSEYMTQESSVALLFDLPKAMMLDQTNLNAAPYFLQKSLLAPYLNGLFFVTYAIEVEGPEAREEIFERPPVSTEQILYPEKYFGPDFDEPTSFTLPDLSPRFGPGWKKQLTNVAGEYSIRLLFEDTISFPVAQRAAAGWDGDVYQLYKKENSDHFLIVWCSVWDTKEDLDDFFTTYGEALAKRDKEAEIESTDSMIVLTSSDSFTLLTKGGSPEKVAMIKTNDPALREVMVNMQIEPLFAE